MKTTLKIFALSVALFGISNISFGQNTATETASSSVTIIKPITIDKARDLQFGSIVSSSTEDIVVTATAVESTVVTTTGATTGNPLAITSATRTSAQFDIEGDPDATFSIDLDDTVDMAGDGDAITVTLTKNLLNAGNVLEDGVAVLYVGGSFTIPAGQVAGVYTGTFDVTVAYE